jgi:hypothetical protein
MGNIHTVSSLGKTWILDLDGTIVKHNGYKLDGKDSLLAGAETLINQISKEDMVIIITSRKEMYRDMTEEFLHEHQIPYDCIVFEAPYGERILVNDRKPSGLDMAIAVNTERDEVMEDKFFINGKL